ncbi:MAG: ABC transporter permease [Acidimicrobiales bacterium]
MARWGRFLLRRVVRVVVVSVVLVTATFLTVRLVPGDPARKAIGMQTDRSAADQARALKEARHDLHLDRSLPVQYVETLGAAFTFDFGRSFQTSQRVTSIISDRLGSTLRLAAGGTIVMLAIGVPLGVLVGALTDGRRRWLDVVFSGVSGFVGSIPPYVLAVVGVFFFAYTWSIFPRIPEGGLLDEVLPSLALGLGPGFLLARVVRIETLDVLQQDYVRTATSKWLPRRHLYLRDVVPNVLTPALTIGGVLFASLLGGAVVVEGIFGRNGLGTTLINAVQLGDYPVVMAISLLFGFMVVAVNTVVDVLLATLDPRTLVAE